MGFFRQKHAAQKPDYTGLQIQTASNTLPIPIVWGWAKVAPNVLWYNNFQVSTTRSGGGKGGGGGTTSVNYSAAVILGLCEGPIAGTWRVWRDQSAYSVGAIGLSIAYGYVPQPVWSYLTSVYPSQALAYAGTAYAYASSYALDSTAAVSNHNFEIVGYLATTGFNGADADPAQVVLDFLTNARYGVGFPAASIAMSTLLGASGDASYQSYCAAIGLCISPALVDQESAGQTLARWLKITNTAAVWSGGQLKFIPFGDTPVVAGSAIPTSVTKQIVATGLGFTPANPGLSAITVCTPAQFVADGGVTYAATGAALTYTTSTTPGHGQYTIAPLGSYVFSASDANTMVSIAYTYRLTTSFTPATQALYALTDNDFVVTGDEDPITVTVSDPFKAHNHVTLTISDRDNSYNQTPIVARDQGAIDRFGLRMAGAIDAKEICDAQVGAMAAQLVLQRSVYIRQTFAFKLSWEYCLLEPMDIVEVSDAALGLAGFPVRILSIEEDDDGLLAVTAEEYPIGVGSAPRYPVTSGQGSGANRNAPAPAINPPILFEPTDALAGALEIWAAVSGSTPSGYGGCFVWISTNGTSFTQAGDLSGYSFQSRMGVLTSSLASVAPNPTGALTIDAVNTLNVSLVESGAALDGGTLSDMTSLATLAYVGGELVSYQNATLTGPNAYALTPLARGVFDSTIGAEASGAAFARLDEAIIKLPFTAAQIGTTIYLKFQAYNPYGGGVQDLSTCVAYPYAITGLALTSPLPSIATAYADYASSFLRIWWSEVKDFRPFAYQIRSGTTWATAQIVAQQAHPPFIAPGPGTYWISPIATPTSKVTVYSHTPISVTVAGTLLTQNVAITDNEQALNWPGTMSAGVAPFGSFPTAVLQLNLATATTGTYTQSGDFDLGYVGVLSINVTCQGAGVSQPITNFLSIPDFLNQQDLLGASSNAFVAVACNLRLSQDGTTFGAWQPYAPGQYSARAVQFQAVMTSLDGTTTPVLVAFGWTISVPARIDHYLGLSVGAGGYSLTFKPDGAAVNGAFNGGPNASSLPTVNVVWPMSAGDYVALSSLTLSGVTVTIMNSGSPVARTGVNVTVEGY